MELTGFIGGDLGYRLLRRIRPDGSVDSAACDNHVYDGQSKLEVLFGPGIWQQVQGKRVMDFGCGYGNEAVDLAQHGAAAVLGIDSRERMVRSATATATAAGVQATCTFSTSVEGRFDVIFSLDAFEHYDEPEQVLALMKAALLPGGRILVCFGPPWLHPYGGHLFSVFPWSHLLFTEAAQLRWRADFKSDGATRFGEVEGGLNQMTVARFRRLVKEAGFAMEDFTAIPIRRLRWLCRVLTPELFTSTVRCTLVVKPA